MSVDAEDGVEEASAAGTVEAVVCIPTFRRAAMLADTLRSVAAQRTARRIAVVIVDNDAEGREGMAVAGAFLARGDMTGVAVLQPERGNVHAINAALSTARATYPGARYLLMIDDDEVASPAWVDEMVASAEQTGADVVGGPVHPRFDPVPSPGIARHPVFHPAYAHTGPVPMIFGSGNFLVRVDALARLAEPRFNPAFNVLGGGDTDFFTRCRKAGFRFHWNEAARIEETVPASRQTLRWILKRSMRIGAINLAVDRRSLTHPAGPVLIHLKTLVVLALSPIRFCRALLASRSLLAASHPPMIALGRISASLGRDHAAYGGKQLS